MTTQTTEQKQMLSIQEVADHLDVHNSTIYRMISDNQLPYVKIRGRKRILRRHLDGWIEKHTVPAAS